MDDKKLNDMIRDSAQNAEVPETLRPENIEKKLREQEAGGKKKNRGKRMAHVLEAAAVLAVVFIAGEQIGERSQLIVLEEPGEMERETPAETTQEVSEAEDQVKDTFTKDAAAEPETAEGIQTFATTAQLYEKLHEFLQSEEQQISMMARNGKILYSEEKADMVMESVPDMAMAASDSDTGVGDGGYSRTNLRDASVDEGDLVKTDGEYIYIRKHNSSVVIVDAKGEKMKTVSVTEPEELNESVCDLYVDGETMVLVTEGNYSELKETQPDVYETRNYDYTKILTYDISDKRNIKLLGSIQQEGSYHSSRKNGQYVYAFTTFRPQVGDTEEESGIMPLVDGEYMRPSDVYAPEEIRNTRYLVVGAVDLKKPDKMCSHKAIVSGAEDFYVSGESIFVMNRHWESEIGDVTDILKFSYENGQIDGVGSCRAEGYLNDSFSLDEYNGYLRVVVTSWKDSDEINGLYVFDEKLNLVGKIEDIAPGETIRSARFMGDVGYFVTFRQTDPLFSADLSDPKNPKILGELKVSGFSSYLHFYGKDRLLGIGYEADEETGQPTGIKLSMFDVSDPSNVTEEKRYVLKDASYCPGLSDYKAIMIDPEKNLFGLVCDENYMVFSYDEEKGFENLLTYHLGTGEGTDLYGWYGYGADTRGLYIDDTFYLADGDVLRAFDMKDYFAQKAKLEF